MTVDDFLRVTPENVADNPIPICLVLGVWMFCMLLVSILPDHKGTDNVPLLGRPKWWRQYVCFTCSFGM